MLSSSEKKRADAPRFVGLRVQTAKTTGICPFTGGPFWVHSFDPQPYNHDYVCLKSVIIKIGSPINFNRGKEPQGALSVEQVRNMRNTRTEHHAFGGEKRLNSLPIKWIGKKEGNNLLVYR